MIAITGNIVDVVSRRIYPGTLHVENNINPEDVKKLLQLTYER